MIANLMAWVKIITVIVMIGGITIAIPIVGAGIAVTAGMYFVYTAATYKDSDST